MYLISVEEERGGEERRGEERRGGPAVLSGSFIACCVGLAGLGCGI